MRVLYVAPRYHTNQVPIMKGWIREGHEVQFISQIVSRGEDHRDIVPLELGFSKLFSFFFKLENKIRGRHDPDEQFAVYSKKGFPPIFKLHRIVSEFKPDFAILRERSVYNIVVYQMCKRMQIPCILYNQSPLWEKRRGKTSLTWKIVRRLSPSYRFTVSLGEEGQGMIRDEHTYYVPFVMEPHIRPEQKIYFADGVVHFLFVARYVEWKNYDVVLPAFLNLVRKGLPVHLTTVGQVGSAAEEEFYQGVRQFVKDNELTSHITMVRDANRDKVFAEYGKADVFLLPSREPISVSQLEAMSCSLPVICSNFPGKASYVKNGENGYLVEAGNREELELRMEQMVHDRERLKQMGARSLELVEENSSFQQYYESILKILGDMKRDSEL